VLIRYDLCERAVWRLRAELVAANAGTEWLAVKDAKARLAEAAMNTRKGLDLQKVEQMVDVIFEATN
jgi:hypothetical protein